MFSDITKLKKEKKRKRKITSWRCAPKCIFFNNKKNLIDQIFTLSNSSTLLQNRTESKHNFNAQYCKVNSKGTTLQCTLYIVQWTFYPVNCTQYTVQCKLYTIQCTVYTVHCTLYTVQAQSSAGQPILWGNRTSPAHSTSYQPVSVSLVPSTLYTVLHKLYTLHCTLYSINCTLYTVHYTLYIKHYTVSNNY